MWICGGSRPVERLEYSVGIWITPIARCDDSSSRYIWSADPDIGLDVEDPDRRYEQFLCCCVGADLDISVKDLFCHTWVAAATIGAQSTVVEHQLVELKEY